MRGAIRCFTGVAILLLGVAVGAAEVDGTAGEGSQGWLLVANKSDDSLSVIQASDGSEVTRLATGRAPHEVAVDPSGRVAVVSNYGTASEPGSTLTRVDLRSLKTTSVDLGNHTRPHGLAWLPDARHLLATTEGTQSVVLVDAEARQLVAAIPAGGARPHMVVAGAGGRYAWVTHVESGSVSKIDLAARKVVITAPAGEGAEGLALASDGRLWTAANGDGSVRVFAADSLEPLASIDVGGMAIRVELAERLGLALVTSATAGRITAIDTRTLEVRGDVSTRWQWKQSGGRFLGGFFGLLPVPVGAQLSVAGDSLYVANSFGGVVVEFSLPGLERLRALVAGREPDGMAVAAIPTGG